jgi:hypothetical protein
MRFAPQSMPASSAGWKMRFTVPEKFFVAAILLAAPSNMVVWPSWPHACMTPAFVLA